VGQALCGVPDAQNLALRGEDLAKSHAKSEENQNLNPDKSADDRGTTRCSKDHTNFPDQGICGIMTLGNTEM